MSDILDPDNSLDGLNSHDGVDDSLGVDDSNILDQSAIDGTPNGDGIVEDPELEAIKARVKEMEAEAEKLKEMQNEVEKQINLSPTPPHRNELLDYVATGAVVFPSLEDKIEADTRSIYVGNVDYSATAEELEQHFHGCGSVNRITILCDKFSGHPKGFAYIEFSDKESVETSLALDGSLFRGRQIKVNPKRTNKPHFHFPERGGGRPRGRPRYRARGYGGGGGGYYGGFPRSRRAFRGRARASYYSPY
uniref:polyadenylate-binding protein 2-like isoform X1 n=1 Tax=Styela clava TaxID=7725 RepID=UPI00193A61DF|nr:polyadenylate-binding protein 2-like isoform X1 [Styela clava]